MTDVQIEITLVSPPTDVPGLEYMGDDVPGLRRIRRGRGFSYVGPDNKVVRDRKTLGRIRSLAIPPAWTDVWISPAPNSHLQATGRDAKGRKQYRYHLFWSEYRNQSKFLRMLSFGEALPLIRDRVERDLALPGLPREKVLAVVVRLLESTFIRVGNREYARQNNSFGLTTLRNRHVEIEGSKLKFRFRGKSGQKHEIEIRDRRLARIIKQMRDLPGYNLFQYIDDDGERQTIGSSDVNDYLREITGKDFSAKDFRTWGGTVLAAGCLRHYWPYKSEAEAKRIIAHAIREVSNHLGNQPSVCRKYYVHPVVISAYMEGELVSVFSEFELAGEECPSGYQPEELSVLTVLHQRLAKGRASDETLESLRGAHE